MTRKGFVIKNNRELPSQITGERLPYLTENGTLLLFAVEDIPEPWRVDAQEASPAQMQNGRFYFNTKQKEKEG